MAKVRLQRYLSQCGVAARRKAEQLIVEGRVRVNRKVVDELGSKVDPVVDKVTVDGEAVYPQDLLYLVLNKPKGCVTSVADPEGRPTVMDYLPGVPVKIAPVGRLDFYSEGVLLLTNDGELASRLLASRYGVDKTYHVKVRGAVKPVHIRALRDGVKLDDGTVTAPAQVDRLSTASKHDWLVITITEGKNRQVRRMLESLGYQVAKLQRVAFAGITFHGLRVGDARELTQGEVNELRRMVKLQANTIARGTWSAKRETTDLARRARARQRERAEVPAAEPATGRSAPVRGKPVRGKPVRGKPARGKPARDEPARGKPARGKPAPRKPRKSRNSRR